LSILEHCPSDPVVASFLLNLRANLNTDMDWLDFFLSLLALERWRLHLCFWGGLFLAVIAHETIPYHPLHRIVAAMIFVMAMVIGFRWDSGRY